MNIYDVIIMGGGPAGLNAAIVLGRCRRKVLLFDHGKQRNRHSHGMHNYLTRDDILPAEFLLISHKELKKYGIKILHKEIKHARKKEEGIFELRDCDGKIYHSKKLILATGLTDILPKINGAEQFYGKSMFHCPYCDGWEVANKKIGVYSKNKSGIEVALTLTTWTTDITLYTDGRRYVRPKNQKKLEEKNITVVNDRLHSLQGNKGKLKNIVLKNGESCRCDALFFSNGYEVQCDLVESLGCNVGKNNVALTNRSQQTNIPGLYVAGDAAREMHFVVVAAAEGAKAGVYVNKELLNEYDLKQS
ncbi:MAG: NAD(P)/FAD-dependent oxidoreductase [Ginsengibacter sp.]